MMAQIASWLQFLHHSFERYILVRICSQRHLLYSPKQGPKCGISRQVAAHHQYIDKKADQTLNFGCRAPRRWCPHYHIILPRVAP